MNDKIEQEEDVSIGSYWKYIAWILALITAFCFFEAMCIEFRSFDEFCIFTMLFIIALQLLNLRELLEKKE